MADLYIVRGTFKRRNGGTRVENLHYKDTEAEAFESAEQMVNAAKRENPHPYVKGLIQIDIFKETLVTAFQV